jgi:hypothetical protein
MPRGKKTSPEVIYQVMAVWSITDNILETARRLDMPEPTVRGIVLANKDKEEFTKLRDKNREEFSDTATRIIGKAMKRLEATIDNEEENIPVNQLTTAIGTLYDKRALAKGESTQNHGFATNSEMLGRLLEIAGYSKVKKDE